MKRVLVFAVVAGLVAASAAVGSGASPGRDAPRIKGATDSTSLNWSGYAATASTQFTDVKGSWTQPAANCSSTTASTSEGPGNNGNGNGNGHGGGGGSGKTQNSYSSFWVGLDGYNSSTVEQTGTDADCNGTTAVYYGWYEFYPAFPVNLSASTYPVQPGDQMSAEVSVSGNTVTVTLENISRGWTFPSSKTSKGYALSSAEWVAEAPSSGTVLPLANFGTVSFSGASATAGNTTGTISAFSNDPMTMVTRSGQTKATPSSLSSDGSSFSVTWSHS